MRRYQEGVMLQVWTSDQVSLVKMLHNRFGTFDESILPKRQIVGILKHNVQFGDGCTFKAYQDAIRKHRERRLICEQQRGKVDNGGGGETQAAVPLLHPELFEEVYGQVADKRQLDKSDWSQSSRSVYFELVADCVGRLRTLSTVAFIGSRELAMPFESLCRERQADIQWLSLADACQTSACLSHGGRPITLNLPAPSCGGGTGGGGGDSGQSENVSVGFPFASGGLSGIMLCQVLHHLPPERVHLLLKECRRCIQPGGFVVLMERDVRNDSDAKLHDIDHLLAHTMGNGVWQDVQSETLSYYSCDEYTKIFSQLHFRRRSFKQIHTNHFVAIFEVVADRHTSKQREPNDANPHYLASRDGDDGDNDAVNDYIFENHFDDFHVEYLYYSPQSSSETTT